MSQPVAHPTAPLASDRGPGVPALPFRVEVEPSAGAGGRGVSVILPMYNEAAGAERVVREVAIFALKHPEYRFTWVDDGSSDGTAGIVRRAIEAECSRSRALETRLRVIGYRANAGKGYAVMRGVAETEGDDDDLLLFTDGDLAYSLDHLPVLAKALERSDVAIGSRRSPDGGYRAHLARNAMGWTYNKLARLCLGATYRDTQAGLKGFRLGAARRIFGALRVSGFAFDVEVLYLARRFGYRIVEVPAQVGPEHRSKPSTVNLLRDPRRMFVGLAGIRVSGALGQYERPGDGRRPLALMSFDTEEFDVPNELGGPIEPARQMAVGAEGMRRALDVLGEVPARATFFTTGAFAIANPGLVREAVAKGHEIASHALTHTRFREEDLKRSREILQQIAGAPVRGFRRPRFAPTDAGAIARAGYTYDSSIHPIWMPGRYNGWRWPRRAFARGDVVEIPVSATPLVRFPLFWLSFKNVPQWMTRVATRWVLGSDGYAALCFHPWELCELGGFGLPRYLRRVDGRSMESRLIRHLRWVSRRATFTTYGDLERRFRAGEWPFGAPASARAEHQPACAGEAPVRG